jgi:hypothetical protein
MSDLYRKIVEESQLLVDTPYAEGGLNGLIKIDSPVIEGDPGWLTHNEYPFLMVQAGRIGPKLETLGRAGWDVLLHEFHVTIMIDNTEFFDPTKVGLEGDQILEDAGTNLFLWMRRLKTRKMDDLPGVRDLVVSAVDFFPQERGEVWAKSALLTLTVERQHQHTP